LSTSTLLNYEKGVAHVQHNWTEPANIIPIPEEKILKCSEENTPTTAQFLHAIFGQRFCSVQKVFGQYATPVILSTRDNNTNNKRVLVLGIYVIECGFDIYAKSKINSHWPARGVSLLKNFPNPRYEVRDD